MQQGSKMLDRLTLETQAHHAVIDARLFAPLERPSRDGYRRFLCLVYGFEAPFETSLAMAPGIQLAFIQARIKSGRIAADLLALGLTPPEFGLLARRHAVPSFKSTAEALGWMYVTERLTLQHEPLRRRLGRHLPFELEHASYYLRTYEDAGERWRAFGALLDRVASTDDVAEQVVAAAWDAFASQQGWLGEHEVPSMVVSPLRAS